MTNALGKGGYDLLGVACFTLMAVVLFRAAKKPLQNLTETGAAAPSLERDTALRPGDRR